MVVLVFVRGWKVKGDLAPIGGTCVRAEVVYFFGGDDGGRWILESGQRFGYVVCLVTPDYS